MSISVNNVKSLIMHSLKSRTLCVKAKQSAFMQDFWNAKYPTLILDRETLTVLEVIY